MPLVRPSARIDGEAVRIALPRFFKYLHPASPSVACVNTVDDRGAAKKFFRLRAEFFALGQALAPIKGGESTPVGIRTRLVKPLALRMLIALGGEVVERAVDVSQHSGAFSAVKTRFDLSIGADVRVP